MVQGRYPPNRLITLLLFIVIIRTGRTNSPLVGCGEVKSTGGQYQGGESTSGNDFTGITKVASGPDDSPVKIFFKDILTKRGIINIIYLDISRYYKIYIQWPE
jgi:hypothetical protein